MANTKTKNQKSQKGQKNQQTAKKEHSSATSTHPDTTTAPAPVSDVIIEDVQDSGYSRANAKATPENASATAQVAAADSFRHVSRSEKKARKLLDGLDVDLVPGACRVVFRRPRDELIVVTNPEVYRCRKSGTYFVFGEPSLQNGNAQPQIAAAKRMARQRITEMNSQGKKIGGAEGLLKGMSGKIDPSLLNEIEELDHSQDKFNNHQNNRNQNNKHAGKGSARSSEASGSVGSARKAPTPTDKDIDLVMEQGMADRETAIKALTEADGDVISAIMNLTS